MKNKFLKNKHLDVKALLSRNVEMLLNKKDLELLGAKQGSYAGYLELKKPGFGLKEIWEPINYKNLYSLRNVLFYLPKPQSKDYGFD